MKSVCTSRFSTVASSTVSSKESRQFQLFVSTANYKIWKPAWITTYSLTNHLTDFCATLVLIIHHWFFQRCLGVRIWGTKSSRSRWPWGCGLLYQKRWESSQLAFNIVSGEVPQVLHRLQNKEKPMQKNFYSPVRVTQNDFRVQHCKVWCGTG